MTDLPLSISRRHLLHLATALAVAGCETLPPPREPTGSSPAPLPAAPVVDVHCHTFNARDLPLRGFLSKVALHDISFPHKDEIIDIIADYLQERALPPAGELEQLRSGIAVAVAPLAPTRSEQRAEVMVFARGALQHYADRTVLSFRSLQERRRRSEVLKRVLDHLSPRALAKRDTPPRIRDAASQTDLAAEGVVAHADINERSYRDPIYGAFRLGALLTRPRAELVRRLAGLPDRNGADVKLFCPAIIDFSYWLQDPQHAGIAEQIDVMSEIFAIKGRSYAVHGWVPFCPWRYTVDMGDRYWTMLRTAIEDRGFVGFKLYPLMGFYPSRNASASDLARFPAALRETRGFPERFDEGLAKLYAYCHQHHVPILAHTAHSQYPDEEGANRGDPANWAQVIKDYPGIRLNLGHLGGLWHLGEDAGIDHRPNPPWTNASVPFLADNVYGDLSDYAAAMEASFADQRLNERGTKALADLLARTPGAKDRLLYGTDWPFLEVQVNPARYLETMATTYPASLGLSAPQARGYLGANAARFLGLIGPNARTRERLERFYQIRGLDPKLLAAFDTPTA